MTTLTAPSPYRRFDVMPIGPRWRAGASGRTLTDTNPWDGSTVTEIPLAGLDDVNEAFATAQAAQADWAAALPEQRAGVLRAAAAILDTRREEILNWLVTETGTPRGKCEVELGVTKAVFLEAAAMPHHTTGQILPSDIPGKENRVYRQPAGVVALISPWDFPLYLTSRSLAPALAVGNAVVLKPASDTPVTGGLMLAKIFEEAGLPPGVLSVIVGSGAEIGDAMVEHPIPSIVSFTGSTGVGIGITQKAGIKRLLMELGGNAPLVVLEDADLDYAVKAATFGSFYNSGQICMIANRVIIDRSIHDQFVDAFVARVASLKFGDPADPATAIGPVINHNQLASVQAKISSAQQAGAKLILGGNPIGPTGLTLPPQVLLGTNEVATAKEEVFGPAITIIAADGEDEALKIANDTEYGLSSAVFTRDINRGVEFALKVKAGMTHVNDSPVNEEDNTAYGGVKQSGLGRFGGTWSIDEFTTHHWVSVQHTPRDFPF
ncbi:aldehyde dehydrogenase [Mycolicibacterium conceptionense]|uniref:Aldehyde dehydrogenase n=1 Tax=Mycolicibacterium conceptionense TaxID=451644 RepID=A0A1A0P5S7_9MYCO|nr:MULTISPECIES: aldehyde dehydrogenase family protein [Mycolicibacterium]MCW1823677.1 aldehyde dehydrogenase family protein [Mycolicibacterium senegalense]OBB05153.1 aldehyde dehydrogenase [Mycolicibacterium conceptionense]OBE94403.1 aldehyde dehydrogenase [Mycolicibacterium conceptionense]OBF22253.1 aldehyde dehydrogenase [Mycolicibacterium conceptionense]OBF39838.1 aldehyde dehydrogenase [Mycolicibacterium conceptionense]